MGKARDEETKIIPLFGKDEMNLIEFPFGPVTSSTAKTLEVEHQAWDRRLRREVTRRMIITGAEKFGLPRPIDDQVLVGMKTLTHESGYVSPKVDFSRYQLCRIIGWEPDGRAYARLEESFDRIAGTTLKFKDAWYDKGEKEFKSKTFHLITEVDLCSRDRLERSRLADGRSAQKLCSFIWTDVIWKSFQDGFIKTLDMEMFRRIGQGRRRDVPLRLYRILDKRFWYGPLAEFKVKRLCVGTLGLAPDYSPSQMMRILNRAANWLIECGYLRELWYRGERDGLMVYFRRQESARLHSAAGRRKGHTQQTAGNTTDGQEALADTLRQWIAARREDELTEWETAALEMGFGSELEQKIVMEEKTKGISIMKAGRIRQAYVRRYVEGKSASEVRMLIGAVR
jgi:hypothetical protein